MGLSYIGRSCLETTCVMGYRRVPDPPARIIAFKSLCALASRRIAGDVRTARETIPRPGPYHLHAPVHIHTHVLSCFLRPRMHRWRYIRPFLISARCLPPLIRLRFPCFPMIPSYPLAIVSLSNPGHCGKPRSLFIRQTIRDSPT